MKVGDFVRDTLLEIVRGVEEAANQTNTAIAPNRLNDEPVGKATDVNFDVDIEVDAKAGGGTSMLRVVEASGEVAAKSTHRVSFSVPVYFGAYWTSKRVEGKS